ncbi:MAG: protein-glutamate O-methyltransferase CheR [Thermodesulfobacteriota bacterium]|nr:protein-glutamate O-methyltransferase CheR [Thermodesulfobacteriota bacterium]
MDLDEFRYIRDYIEGNCGISLTDEKMYLVETRLTTLMAETGCRSFIELCNKAVADSTHRLRDKIVEAMTTNETFWFRDEGPFSILEEVVFGELAAEIQSGKRSRIRIWCAACSTGQEPYSIAMAALEFAQKQRSLNPEHVEILGTDISSTVVYLAMAGRYDRLAISRGLPESIRDRYFEQDGNVWCISNDVKKMVKYEKMNLQESFSHLGKQDIIFCRNVLIYFSNEFKMDVLRRMAQLLSPNGYLFLGASEAIMNCGSRFRVLRHARGLYYGVKQKE